MLVCIPGAMYGFGKSLGKSGFIFCPGIKGYAPPGPNAGPFPIGGLILGIPLLDPGVAASLLGGVSDFGTGGDDEGLLFVSFCGSLGLLLEVGVLAFDLVLVGVVDRSFFG